ncbi:MAG: lasso peptide biosynthesis B2 protein [Candidatus Acidiferrum sp.]
MERSARGLFLRASVLLPLISVSLHWRGFRKTRASLQYFVSVTYGSQNPDAQTRAELTAEMVRAAGRHGIGNRNCLKESLALWWLLGRQGVASDLRVGVRKDREKFEAHAWVECGGAVLNDPETMLPYFAAFDEALASLPPEPR